jgi:uncharacterized protein (TIGR00730 family)
VSPVASLCVYCGSHVGHEPAHRQAAARLGAILAERKIELVYGGGGIGLMGVLADSALAHGGRVIGVIPAHLQEFEVQHGGLTELIIVGSMHERKRVMFERSEAFLVLPGGMGTLDETIEIITWKQLRLHSKPVVLIDNVGYWAPLLRLFEAVAATGFSNPDSMDLFTVVGSVEDALDAVARSAAPAAPAAPERM